MSDDHTLDPAGAAVVAKIRRLMLISGLFTLLAIGGILAVIGYRVYRSGEAAPTAAEVTATLPRGAKVVGTAVTEERIVLTIEVGGQTELRLFDARSLQPRGRLRLQPEP